MVAAAVETAEAMVDLEAWEAAVARVAVDLGTEVVTAAVVDSVEAEALVVAGWVVAAAMAAAGWVVVVAVAAAGWVVAAAMAAAGCIRPVEQEEEVEKAVEGWAALAAAD